MIHGDYIRQMASLSYINEIKKYDKISYKKATLYLNITLCDIFYFKSKQNTDNWVDFIP